MEGKSVNFNTQSSLYDSPFESIARWLSCNGEIWGMGPTAVFASAAALFLYNELEATIFLPGDHSRVSLLEKTLISTMVLGMLALMIHLWVCCMRFIQYYLDTLIKDSPNMLLEMTTASILGSQAEIFPLSSLTRFLKQQQPQIHITVCWFLSLCYADYVRKNYCRRFNMPYLELWQTELHDRARRGVHRTMAKVNSFVGTVHQRLRNYTTPVPTPPPTTEAETVRSQHRSLQRRSISVGPPAGCHGEGATPLFSQSLSATSQINSSINPAKLLRMRLKNSGHISRKLDARATVQQSLASILVGPRRKKSLEEFQLP